MCRLSTDVMNSTKRIEWLDFARGAIIILLIFGHTEISRGVFRIIYSFHVSAFYVMSGYVFSVKKFASYREFLKHKICTLLVPYISFSIIHKLFLIVCATLGMLEYSLTLQSIIGMFLQVRGSVYESGLWFLTCLFVIQSIAWAFEKE